MEKHGENLDGAIQHAKELAKEEKLKYING